ncbi:transporter substrate-binding domain-containing protein [Litoribacillus peritrichatus]|uniref:Transporter substrate-binding domain-containing protein n=1 Tax=Litoribacillus peritrichatus TaxID=718191 RepID=A0ABP7N1V9_9GAMM
MSRCISILFGILFSVSCLAETFVAAGDPWPPFLDPDKPNQGIALEITRAALKTQGHELQMQFMPWARAINEVKEADSDILVGTWYTEERTKFLMYSDPYLENQIKFIKRKNDDFEYSGLDSLTGKNIGVVRGYGYGDAFLTATNFKRPESKNLISNIKKLIAGRIDLTLEDEVVARDILKRTASQLLNKIEFTSDSLSSNKLHITVGLSNSRKEEIISAFNKGLKEIKANGTYDALLKQYGF